MNKDLARLIQMDKLSFFSATQAEEYDSLKSKLEEQLQTWDDEQYRNIVWNANQYHDLRPKYEKLQQEKDQIKDKLDRIQKVYDDLVDADDSDSVPARAMLRNVLEGK